MKRFWMNLSKGKKIAGLVIICLAVVLGYFGYHRLTTHAEEKISKGVINDIAQLPTNMNAKDGTAENPFVILEIVPYVGEAEIGYMIDGCEPIDFSEQKSKLYNNQVSIGSTVTTVFKDEYDREQDSYNPAAWNEDPNNTYTAAGYYEKVESGKGNFVYSGTNYEDASGVLSNATVYRPNFTKVADGTGDFIWVSVGDGTFNLKTQMVQENLFATTPEETISFKLGDREYTTRTDTGTYSFSSNGGAGDYHKDRRYVHFNQFLRTALSVRTQKDINEFHIVVKTIEPWELNAYPEWLDYSDLIYMHHGACSVGALTEYWNDSANRSYLRINDTNSIDGKNNVTNPSKTKVVGDRFSYTDDFSWEVAKKLFLKVNALEQYDGSGSLPFAPLMFDSSILNAKDDLFGGNKQTVTHYPLDYTTMDAAKTTNFRGYEDNLAKNVAGYQSNFYKFLIMNFLMKQENFHKYFFKNARKSTGTCVIQENGGIGLHSSQDEGDSQKYWSVDSFLPVPDTMSLQWSDEIIKLYGINYQGGAFMNFIGNIALAGGTFTYNADNMFSQMFNSDIISNNSQVSDAFEWYQDEYGKDYSSISPVQMIHYLLNYKKKGTGDEENPSRKKETLRVLEIEPCNEFTLDETYLTAYLPPSRFSGNIEIDYMTTQEFTGSKKDINGEYDLVYIGMNDGKFNHTDSGLTTYNYTKLNKRILLHVGDKVKEDYLFSGNDISTLKRKQLKEYVQGGNGLLLAKELSPVSPTNVDKSSHLYKFAKNDVTDKDNVIPITSLSYAFLNNYCVTFNDSKLTVTDSIAEYSSEDGTSGTQLSDSKLDFTFTIGEPKKKAEGEENSKYGVKIFMDVNYDGVVADNSEESEVVYDSYVDVDPDTSAGTAGGESVDTPKQYYEYSPKAEGETDAQVVQKNTHRVTFDFNSYYKNRGQATRRNGAIAWKFVVYDISNPEYYITKTGTSWYNGAGSGKMEIEVYQIVADDDDNTAVNLQSAPSLFTTYTQNLQNYKINVTTETLSEYIAHFGSGDSKDSYSETTESLFTDYNVFLISCGTALQKADDSHGAVSFITKQAREGASVLYTGNAVSRKSSAAASITQGIKNVLNQSRFTDSTASYVDTPEALGSTYNLDNFKSLEYTYAAAMEDGEDTYFCFDNNQWKQVDGTSEMQYGAGSQEADKITRLNKGSITTYPYTISEDVNVSGIAAKDYQLNMNNSGLTVWYCLGGDDNTTYGISPNDATNNYYLYTVGNVTYSGVELGEVSDAMEMKLFINTLIGSYEIGYRYPNVVVNQIKGIESDRYDCLELLLDDSSTDSMKLYNAKMPRLKKQYLEYVPSPKPIASATPEPTPSLDPEETAGPEATKETEVSAPTPKPTPIRVLYEASGDTPWNLEIGKSDSTKISDLVDSNVLRIKYHCESGVTATQNVYSLKNQNWQDMLSIVACQGDSTDPTETQNYYISVSDLKTKGSDLSMLVFTKGDYRASIDAIYVYASQSDAEADTAGSSGGSSGSGTSDPDTPESDPTITSKYEEELASSSTFIQDALDKNKNLSHRIYFTPYDNNISGGNIRSLRISLVNHSETEEDKTHSLIKTIYQDHRDIATNKRFIRRYKANSQGYFTTDKEGTYNPEKEDLNFLKDGTQYYFLYDQRFINGMYAGVKYNYVKFEIENKKKKGTTYLNLFPDAQTDNMYVFPLD